MAGSSKQPLNVHNTVNFPLAPLCGYYPSGPIRDTGSDLMIRVALGPTQPSPVQCPTPKYHPKESTVVKGAAG